MEQELLLQNEEDFLADQFFGVRYFSQKFTHGRKARCSRLFTLFLTVVVTVSLVSWYRNSMREVEARECHDVLSDCEGVPFNETIVPPFYNYLQDFAISRRYGLSLCLIPKVMSTISTATLCYLEDPVAFRADNRTISTEHYLTKFCKENEMKSFEMVKRKLHREDPHNIVIVRDPFDRFISGFTDKCVNDLLKRNKHFCHGCDADLRCFLRKEYRRLRRMSMLFPVYTRADTHFAPQTWFCGMERILKNTTLIKYANTEEERKRMIGDFSDVFRKSGVPEEDIAEVRRELSKGKSHHSTSGSDLRHKYEQLIREDPAIRRAILRIYYHDFELIHKYL